MIARAPAVVAALLMMTGAASAEEADAGAFDAVPFDRGSEASSPPASSGASSFEHDPFSGADLGDPEIPAAERAADFAPAGREALEGHRYEEAARLLRAAYLLSAEPSLLYPLAQALERMGEPVAAAERLERYLSQAELEPEQRVSVGQELEAMRRQFSRVTIDTEPGGALLSLGGERLGTTPLGRDLLLTNGEYLVEARLEGHADAMERLAVPGGAPVELLLRLEPLGEGRAPGARLDLLEISMWSAVALAGAFAIAAAVTGSLAAAAFDELVLLEERTGADGDGYRSLASSTYGLSGAAGAFTLTAAGLAIARALRADDDEER